MTPLFSAYVACACLLGLATALATLCASQRMRQWFFAQVWASGGGASRVDAKLRDAKRTLFRGIAGRVLDVGSGEGVNLKHLAMLTRTGMPAPVRAVSTGGAGRRARGASRTVHTAVHLPASVVPGVPCTSCLGNRHWA